MWRCADNRACKKYTQPRTGAGIETGMRYPIAFNRRLQRDSACSGDMGRNDENGYARGSNHIVCRAAAEETLQHACMMRSENDEVDAEPCTFRQYLFRSGSLNEQRGAVQSCITPLSGEILQVAMFASQFACHQVAFYLWSRFIAHEIGIGTRDVKQPNFSVQGGHHLAGKGRDVL